MFGPVVHWVLAKAKEGASFEAAAWIGEQGGLIDERDEGTHSTLTCLLSVEIPQCTTFVFFKRWMHATSQHFSYLVWNTCGSL